MIENSNISIDDLKVEVQKYLDENFVEKHEIYFSVSHDRDETQQPSQPLSLWQKIQKILKVRSTPTAQPINFEEELGPTFSQVLFEFIKEKNISDVDCYKNANIDRRLFSKIRSNNKYQPSKNTVFALCMSLQLNLDESKKLLDCAGYSISHSLECDVIMECLIKKEVYDILLVNEILVAFDCQPLGAN